MQYAFLRKKEETCARAKSSITQRAINSCLSIKRPECSHIRALVHTNSKTKK